MLPASPSGLTIFAKGGLDLFSESFVLTAKVSMIRAGDVIGLKGRLAADAIDMISAQVPHAPSHPPGNRKGKHQPISAAEHITVTVGTPGTAGSVSLICPGMEVVWMDIARRLNEIEESGRPPLSRPENSPWH